MLNGLQFVAAFQFYAYHHVVFLCLQNHEEDLKLSKLSAIVKIKIVIGMMMIIYHDNRYDHDVND